MRLVKHCSKKNNILSNPEARLQLGSLFYYRGHENDEIGDKEEGIFTYRLMAGKNAPLTLEASNVFFSEINVAAANAPKPDYWGSANITVDENLTFSIVLGPDGQPTSYVSGFNGIFRRELFNLYMLCMSLESNEGETGFGSYDDRWSIPFEQADKLCEAIAQALATQTPVRAWNGLDERNPINGNGTSILMRHGLVKYLDKNIQVDGDDPDSIANLLECLHWSAFIKPTSYSKDNEYRFIFLVTRDGFAFEPADDFVKVDVLEYFDKPAAGK